VSLERVLLTGGGGQLASDLELRLARAGEVYAPPREKLDVTDDAALERVFAELAPRAVFNCAAFHNVEVCERDEARAFAVNVQAVKRLAERCRNEGAKLVHLSTNYVFDGERSEPYGEHDCPSPRSVYAVSKLAGEHAARAYAPGALVVRSAGLYGMHGSASKGGNFVTRMIARAREQGELRMVADQRLNPTYTADLAEALVEAVEAGVGGLIHLTNSDECSWYDFTRAIMEEGGIDVPIEPVETDPAAGVARPLNGVLARPAADAAGLSPLRPWREALRDYMRRARLAATDTAQPS
jgi:dTDP-4-dehydrorhamnose reductase